MREGKIRHLFPGGNTPRGFYSYYNYIIPADTARIFIMKGGPGTGKSTFMRRIGQALLARGHDLEHHHCSSDNGSLDGLVIPALGVAFIDGTAPHVVDPRHPGCVDEIIHLGDYWDENKMIAGKQDIIACTAEIGKSFQRAYRLLAAAKALYDDWEAANAEALDHAVANRRGQELLAALFRGIDTVGAGRLRKLFASAITPDGLVHYLDTSVWPAGRCFVVAGDPGSGKSTLVRKVIDAALVRGLDVEAFYCPLDPDKPEHVLIPALDAAVTTSFLPHPYPANRQPALAIDMNQCLKKDIAARRADAVAYDQDLFWELFVKSVACIKRAKTLHDELETYYVPNMDFKGIEARWQQTLERVLAYQQ
jgi:hypothetical protein